MNATMHLLTAYKTALNIKTDSAAADRLALSRSAVSLWRKGNAHPDAQSIEKMALAIGELPGPWLAKIEAERAHTHANKQVWLRLAQTLATAGAIAAIAVIANQANAAHVHATTAANAAYCVKLQAGLRCPQPGPDESAPSRHGPRDLRSPVFGTGALG